MRILLILILMVGCKKSNTTSCGGTGMLTITNTDAVRQSVSIELNNYTIPPGANISVKVKSGIVTVYKPNGLSEFYVGDCKSVSGNI